MSMEYSLFCAGAFLRSTRTDRVTVCHWLMFVIMLMFIDQSILDIV